MSKASLLKDAARQYGFGSIQEMFECTLLDSVAPAICTKCGYTTDMEPDQTRGWCEECEANTVVSVLVLGGLI